MKLYNICKTLFINFFVTGIACGIAYLMSDFTMTKAQLSMMFVLAYLVAVNTGYHVK